MSANVETMFYTREEPWHGLGIRVEEAPTSREALILAGLNWKVIQKPVKTEDGLLIDGFKANVKDTDDKVLGVVTDRYKVVQNEAAFAFTDEITPYLVFMNSHDGSGSIKAAMTPIRVVCQNTLNLALSKAKRCWTANHVGDISRKMEDARNTLLLVGRYMGELGKTIEQLNRAKIADKQVMEYID